MGVFQQQSSLLFCLFLATSVFSQESLIERLSEQDRESGVDSENILQELLAEPIDLNLVKAAELHRLPFLESDQIDSFLQYRKTNVYYSTIEEALVTLSVSGDTLELCQRIFYVSIPEAKTPWFANARWRLGKPSTVDPNWPGAPYRLYSRFDWRMNNFRFGLLSERDPGEERLDDHRAFFAEWQRQRTDENWHAVLGHYQIEWGQGLALWGPYGSSVSADVHAASRRWGRGIRAYRSTNEQAALYGIAAAYARRKIQLLAFANLQRHDTRLIESNGPVSYRESGYHRTGIEKTERDNLKENTFGAGLKLSLNDHSEIGFLLYSARFDQAWHIGDPAASFYNFTGRQNYVLSLMGKFNLASLRMSFETVQSKSGGKAVSVAVSQHERILGWTAGYHHYDTNFHSPHGRSLTGFDQVPQGSAGYSIGMRIKPVSFLLSELFYERNQGLWRSQQLSFPSAHNRFGARFIWKINRRSRFQLHYRIGANDELLDPIGRNQTRGILPNRSESLRFEFEQQVATRLKVRPRVDFARQITETFEWNEASSIFEDRLSLIKTVKRGPVGNAVSVEVVWQALQNLTVNLRHVLFDTPTPIYIYERDLPGVFTVRALRDSGSRRYIYFRYHLLPNINLTGKFACTEQEISVLDRKRNCAWGVQIDWAR